MAIFFPAAAAADPTGSIAGTVTDAATSEPIEGIEVCVWYFEGEEELACTATDSSGEYELGELEAGEYEVEFWGRPLNYLTQYWNGKAHYLESDPVLVEAGPVTGIDAELVLGGEIQGTVLEAGSEAPLEEVEVCAWDYVNEGYAACTYTAFDGSYSLKALPSGEYQIEFWPWEGNLISQLYDHKYAWSEADVVSVEAGEAVTGIDADLEAGGEISGTVYSGATGSPLGLIYVCSVEAASGELWSCSETDEDGHYVLDRLFPGSYKVAFSLDFSEFFEEEEEFEEEDDGFLTQFYNQKATLAEADVLSVEVAEDHPGIDAHLLSSSSPPLSGSGTGSGIVAMAPAAAPSVTTPAPAKRHGCRKGFKKRRIKGKVRCVKIHKRHRRHRASARPGDDHAPPAAGRELQRLFKR